MDENYKLTLDNQFPKVSTYSKEEITIGLITIFGDQPCMEEVEEVFAYLEARGPKDFTQDDICNPHEDQENYYKLLDKDLSGNI